MKDRQRKEREKAREAALAVAKRVADEKKKLLERSRKRWEDGEDEDDEDEVSSEKIESKQEEEDSLTLEAILREKEEIRKLLESLDVKAESKSSSSVVESKSDREEAVVKEEKVRRSRKKKNNRKGRKTRKNEKKNPKIVVEPNESERMLMLQFSVCHEDARKTLRDSNGDLVRAVLKLTEMQVEDIVKMSENHIETNDGI